MRVSWVARTVRVRFAPSPTGQLHLGGLRTLLINSLFARSQGGQLILRIEDTDRERLVPGSEESLMDTVSWLGLSFDEGPCAGGSVGPYTQSKRLPLYKEAAERLVEGGRAYRCFCSRDRMLLLRKEALKNRETPRYDNRCRELEPKLVAGKLRTGVPHTIRLKLPSEGPCSHSDLVFGELSLDMNEGDPIIFKSDGFLPALSKGILMVDCFRYPTYHLANVVDDHAMGITHVIRGQEWLPSVPKHLTLYSGLGWSPPTFAHLPLMVDAAGRKLSKRNADVFVEHYKSITTRLSVCAYPLRLRSLGFFPLSLLNYVMRAGGGFRGGRDLTRLYSIDEMAKDFELRSLKRSPIVTDPEWMSKFNKMALGQVSDAELVPAVRRMIHERHGPPDADCLVDLQSDAAILRALGLARARIGSLGDLFSADFGFLWSLPKSAAQLRQFHDAATCRRLADELLHMFEAAQGDWDTRRLTLDLKDIAEKEGLKVSHVMRFVRVGLTETKVGPPVADLLAALGPAAALQRTRHLSRLLDSEH